MCVDLNAGDDTPRPATVKRVANGQIDPIRVYCRLLPIDYPPCVFAKDCRTVHLKMPSIDSSLKNQVLRETRHNFEEVFESKSTQIYVFQVVAMPLIQNLLYGNDSLLFAYGVTGSGKTYTMSGERSQKGIMPRCLDVLFGIIRNVQMRKGVLKSGRFNDFFINENAATRCVSSDKYLIKRNELILEDNNSKYRDNNEQNGTTYLRNKHVYAVFITYVEVYNNIVYDLLEDVNDLKPMQGKRIRADVHNNMYVQGVTQIEVKNVEEAMTVCNYGIRRKHMSSTNLNAHSSRSHSVFNIRLVQMPVRAVDNMMQLDKRLIKVSALSLVDLAGSERTARTNNTGMRLRETGNINKSLMTLRTCLEYLRENQKKDKNNAKNQIPYRNCKITHLFKGYFDGRGHISMIVCVNPSLSDYDENIDVMKFAQITREVKFTMPNTIENILSESRRRALRKISSVMDDLKDYDKCKVSIETAILYAFAVYVISGLKPNFFQKILKQMEKDAATFNTDSATNGDAEAAKGCRKCKQCSQANSLSSLYNDISKKTSSPSSTSTSNDSGQSSFNDKLNDSPVYRKKNYKKFF